MKLFILGVNSVGNGGQLAQALWSEFVGRGHEVRGIVRGELDVFTDRVRLAKMILDDRPDVVINATAFTRVDDAEREEFYTEAMQVNGEALDSLATACRSIDALLIHYSTDYVASGDAEIGFSEDDACAPQTVYGQSKLLGEEMIQRVGGRYYILRTSWLYGPGGKNFVNTMVQLAKDRTDISVVSDQFGVPNYTLDLARVTREMIEQDFASGIYHPVAEGSCSWAGFAREIFSQINMPMVVHDQSTEQWLAAQHAAGRIVASRPKYSVLKNSKLPPEIFRRTWQSALAEYLATISS